MTKSNSMRSWWKPWTWSTRTWLFAILFSVMISPFVTRWICLWQIPDVVLPFDVLDVVQSDLPANQNAFTVYENVMKMLESNPGASPTSGTEPPGSQSETSREELLQRLFGCNEQAFAEYIRAGEMERADGPSLKTATFWDDLSLHQRLRQLARNYSSLGQTLEESGDLEKAWACHRANLQLSIHAEHPGFAICALVGISMRTIINEPIVHWASNPSLTAERLRVARNDIAREYARRISIFTMAKCEYLSARNTMNELEGLEFLIGNPGTKVSRPKPLSYGIKAVLWCIAQPELVLRLNRQLLLNNMTELDKPLHLRRRATKQVGQFIFELDPAVQRLPGQLSGAYLVHALSSNAPVFRISRSIVPANTQLDGARRRDNARFAALTVLFAAHEFQRSHGQFPETIDQLVPSHLDEIPFDPMDEKGGPMHYRREADGTAIVWSNGPNGIDDHGIINTNENLDTGYLIKINPPADDQPGKEESKSVHHGDTETTAKQEG